MSPNGSCYGYGYIARNTEKSGKAVICRNVGAVVERTRTRFNSK